MAKGKREQAPRHGISVFYVVYFLCLIAWSAAVFAACRWVRTLLAEYEGAQPKYLAQEVFERYFSPIDYDTLLAEADYDAGFADRDTVRAYLAGQVGEEPLSWSVGSSGSQEEIRCIVKAGRKQVGSFTLTLAEETTEHGFATYAFSGVELALDPEAIPGGVLTFTAPADCTVVLDGTALTAEQRISSYLDTEALPYYAEGVEGIEYAVYTLAGLRELPGEISVTDGRGGESEVTFDKARGGYFAGPAYNRTLEETWGPFVLEVMEGYAGYMQRAPGSSFEGIQQYFETGSILYQAVKNASYAFQFMSVPARVEYTDEVLDEFYAFGEDEFCCRAALSQVIYRSESQKYTEFIDMYVFFRRTDGVWRVHQWYNNNYNG